MRKLAFEEKVRLVGAHRSEIQKGMAQVISDRGQDEQHNKSVESNFRLVDRLLYEADQRGELRSTPADLIFGLQMLADTMIAREVDDEFARFLQKHAREAGPGSDTFNQTTKNRKGGLQ
jgi:hypothetical protein